jgi:hypothetical protein
MHKALEQKLAERWPTWFKTGGDVRHTLMSWGFCHGDGWFDILWRLCEDLEPLVAEFEQTTGLTFEVIQVKEKFGGLRIHVNHANDAICQRIYTAAEESFRACEVCGQPGQQREGGWIGTFCDEHDASAESRNLMARRMRNRFQEEG